MRQQQRINIISTQKKVRGGFDSQLSIATRAVLDMKNNVQIDPDNLPQTLTNLLNSAGAAAAISTTITGTDLTVSGTLTTLTTNINAHTTQGLALALALKTLEEIVTAITPVTTNSQSFNILNQDETVYATPAGNIAALTIVFPSDANSRIGQTLRLVSTQTVSTLTVTSAGLTLVGTAVTALVVNTSVSWKKVAASTWLRLS